MSTIYGGRVKRENIIWCHARLNAQIFAILTSPNLEPITSQFRLWIKVVILLGTQLVTTARNILTWRLKIVFQWPVASCSGIMLQVSDKPSSIRTSASGNLYQPSTHPLLYFYTSSIRDARLKRKPQLPGVVQNIRMCFNWLILENGVRHFVLFNFSKFSFFRDDSLDELKYGCTVTFVVRNLVYLVRSPPQRQSSPCIDKVRPESSNFHGAQNDLPCQE